jgi:hypothetical protein
MIDAQNLPGGTNADHRVYSSFFSDNNVIQQVAIVHPKNLVIDGLRKIFRSDSVFTYRDDEYGFPSGGGSYKPISFNQNMTYKHRVDYIENEYGARRAVSTPSHRVYDGRWELSFDIQIHSESYSELEELVDIVSIALQYSLWNELRENGLFIKGLNIGAESAEPYANDYVYSQNITISTLSEWRVEIPIENIVEKIVFRFEPSWHPIPGVKDESDLLAKSYKEIIDMAEIE